MGGGGGQPRKKRSYIKPNTNERNERPCPVFDVVVVDGRESGELFPLGLHRDGRRTAEITFQISIGHFDFPVLLRGKSQRKWSL